jgi:DDHD domain
LGSVITWDVLNHQSSNAMSKSFVLAPLCHVSSFASKSAGSMTGYYSPANESDCSTTPELTSYAYDPPATALSKSPDRQSTYPQLSFPVDNFFLLGSPVPVFLMIRNQRKPLNSDFYLSGCRRVFNIFHPYDPVAYRLEGCIDPRNSNFEPALIRHWNGGFRVQYRTRRMWRKIVATTNQTQRTVIEAFEQGMARAFGTGRDEEDAASEASADKTHFRKVLTGCLNRGHRIDYMLQEKEIESANEYVAALAAHSSYWIEKDLSLFIERQIYLSSLEYQNAVELDGSDPNLGASLDS